MYRPVRILLLPALLLVLTGCAEKAMHLDAAKRLEATDPASAADECRKALADKPNDPEANMELGALLTKLNDTKGAEEAYKNAIKGDAHSVEAHIKLGNLFLLRKNTDEAKQEFDLANVYDPKSVPALTGQGDVFQAKGDMSSAVGKYKDATNLDPDNIATHETLAQALGKMDKFDDAKVEIEKIRELKEHPPKPKS